MDDYDRYKQDLSIPTTNLAWFLHGAGMENFHLIEKDMPMPGRDEMLMRVDAISICYSDVKLILAGNNHPRVLVPLDKRPTVPGHEVSLTVLKPGESVLPRFKPGERYIIQADIFKNGQIDTFGYTQNGGMACYVLLKNSALNGDHGCYLLAISDQMGFSEAATIEPWACVEHAYNILRSTGFKRTCRALIADGLECMLTQALKKTGCGSVDASPDNEPDRIFVPADIDSEKYAAIEQKAARGAVIAFITSNARAQVFVDPGAIHYRDLRLISGTAENVIDLIKTEDRKELRKAGSAFFVGAGGPMGQMHIQRAVDMKDGPEKIAVSDISIERLKFMHEKFTDLATEKGIIFGLFDANRPVEDLRNELLEFSDGGFDDIIIMTPKPALVTESQYLAGHNCLINIFAGIPLGSSFRYDTVVAEKKNLRFTGSSGSTIKDLQKATNLVTEGSIRSDSIVRAIGGINVLKEGVQAVADGIYPGKVVIYPNLGDLPLLAINKLAGTYPSVDAYLVNADWNKDAERELFNVYRNRV